MYSVSQSTRSNLTCFYETQFSSVEMSYDESAFLDSYEGPTNDGTIISTPGLFARSNTFDYGSNFSYEFDHIFSASPAPSQASFECQDDWLIEFYKLQASYFEGQLALSQTLHNPEFQTRYGEVAKATLPLGAPLIIDNTTHDQSPSSASGFSERSRSSIPMKRRSSNMTEINGLAESSTVRPKMAKHEPPEDAERPRGRMPRNQVSDSQPRKHSPDRVPLYDQGGCNAATAVSQLRNMENGFRAETTRRIAQVQNSKI
ncbi:hypothetical protein F4678DRAFT_421568, partial [Xylaria arbuscula]